jgi:hypothetical protein
MRPVLGKRTRSSQGLAPFYHAFDAKSGRKLRFCPVAAIVSHRQEHLLVSFLHLDGGSGGLCMTHDVGEVCRARKEFANDWRKHKQSDDRRHWPLCW